MRKLSLIVLLAAACVTLGPLGSASGPKTAVTTHTVTIENMQFSPADLTVHKGDRIVWVNKDLFPHTATSNDKTFDSGSIDSGGSWRYEANKKGDYSYGCTFHPTMKGGIHVR